LMRTTSVRIGIVALRVYDAVLDTLNRSKIVSRLDRAQNSFPLVLTFIVAMVAPRELHLQRDLITRYSG
jgi:hypothetical protein